MFTTDFFISGIAPHGDHVVVLSFDEDKTQHRGGKTTADRPHLRILDPKMDFCDELSNDALSIRGFQEYRCNDYHFGKYFSLISNSLLRYCIIWSAPIFPSWSCTSLIWKCQDHPFTVMHKHRLAILCSSTPIFHSLSCIWQRCCFEVL